MTSSVLRGPNVYMLILCYISVTSPCRKLEYAFLPLSQRAPVSPLGIKLLNINGGDGKISFTTPMALKMDLFFLAQPCLL